MGDYERRLLRAADPNRARPLRVLPLMTTAPISHDAELAFLSLTDWTTYSDLHWFFAAENVSTDVGARLQGGLRWSCSDDVGNAYESIEAAQGGNSANWNAHTWLVPSISASARILTVRFANPIDGQELVVHLSVRDDPA